MLKFDSEKSLEDFVHNYFVENEQCLIDKRTYQFCGRQFQTKGYGTIDLLFGSFWKDKSKGDEDQAVYELHAVELKNEPICTANLGQVARYRTALVEAFDKFNDEDLYLDLSCSLVVPKGVKKSEDCCYISNHLDGINVVEFELDPFKGIIFEHCGNWHRPSADPIATVHSIAVLAGVVDV